MLAKILRRLRSMLVTSLALACILAAVLVGLARLTMPMVSRYQPEMEAWLSERIGQPVKVESLSGRWTSRGPVVGLTDMRILDPQSGSTDLQIGAAEIYFDIVDWIAPGRRPNRFRILGAQLVVHRLADGRLQFEGLGARAGAAPADSPQRNQLGLVFRQGTIELSDTQIRFSDQATGVDYLLDGVNLTLDNSGRRHLLQLICPSPNDAAGELELRLEAFGHPTEGQVDRISVYLRSTDVDLAAWTGGVDLLGVELLSGRLNAELWGELYDARLAELNGQVELLDLIASSTTVVNASGIDEQPQAVEPRYALSAFSSSLQWRSTADFWQLGLSEILLERDARSWPQSNIMLRSDHPGPTPQSVEHSGAPDGGPVGGPRGESGATVIQLGADFLRIQDLVGLVLLSDQLPDSLRTTLYDSAPSGELNGLQMVASLPADGSEPVLLGQTRFDDLSLISNDPMPGVSGLSGEIASDGEKAKITLASEDFLLRLPQVFRHTLPPLSLAGDIHVRKEDYGWLFEAPEFALAGSGFSATSRFHVELDGTGPFIDATVDVRDGDLRTATEFLPTAQWDAHLVNWLRSALVAGDLTSAGTIIRGDLDDWPFANGEGTFITRINAEDGVFAFAPDWPTLEGLDATIEVIGNELRVDGKGGTILGSEIISGQAIIPNLRKTVLSVTGSAQGTVAQFRDVIRQSPLEGFLAQYFADIDLQGDAGLEMALRIPMTGDDRHISVDGEIILTDSTVRHSAWNAPFGDVEGTIVFSEEGFATRDLDASMNGQPVEVELEVGPEFAPTGLTMMAYISGEFEPSEILTGYPTLMPVASVASGRSKWNALLTAPRELKADGQRRTHMTLTSDLRGTHIDLPKPLGKPSAEVLPLSLSLSFPFQGGDVQLIYGDRVSARASATPQGSITAGVLHFGDGMPSPMPDQGIRLEGQLEELDGAGWVAMAALVGDSGDESGARTTSELLDSMDLSVSRLSVLGREFSDAELRVDQRAAHWHARIKAEGLMGEVRLPADPAASDLVVAEFSELIWPAVDGESAPVTLDPRNLPALHVYVEHLSLYGVDYGEARLQTYPTANGLHIETLEADSDRMELRAKGDWRQGDDGPYSEFAINLISENLGDMLSSLGFVDAVDGGQTIASLSAQWPGAPVDFKLANVHGELNVSVSNGRIPEAELGAGKILGLLSLNAIPRRLALDFTDLFESGLGFDSIEGTFFLRQGEAWTDDLSIRGPALDIAVSGRTGLVSQDYDQIMVVVPKVGVTLPLVGALAAGPGGAAAGFLLSNIFSSAIDDMSQFQYTVTGSWDDPVIELRGAVAASGGPAPTGS